MRVGFVAVAMIAGLAGAVPIAQAQMFNQIGKNGRGPETPTPPVAPPPALPGAGSGAGAAPLTRVPADMEPNDALFDAINRGDIASARDALSRGADLHGRNILGMTPLELSVDLGRNDISFMLLSMRAADDTRPAQLKSAAATKPEPKSQVRQQARRTPAHTAAPVAANETARLFAGDGGAPNPNAGFLGFDSSRR